MRESVARLADAIEGVGEGLLLVITGAGVSHASGIPTFRGQDAGAVWRRTDIALATRAYFEIDPVGQWLWYIQRFSAIKVASPNPAHEAIAWIERWLAERQASFCLVTQNIDLLHEAAGSRDPIKVHGTSARVRCSATGCALGSPAGSIARQEVDLEPFTLDPVVHNIPTCPECGSLIRVHVLLFDEFYTSHIDYRFDEAEEAAQQAAAMVFVGTSFSVGVTDLFLRAGSDRGVPMFSVDPAGGRTLRAPSLRQLSAPAEELLPAVRQELERRG